MTPGETYDRKSIGPSVMLIRPIWSPFIHIATYNIVRLPLFSTSWRFSLNNLKYVFLHAQLS